MKLTPTPLARWLAWVLVGTQLLTPAALAQAMLPEITRSGADSSVDKTDQPEAEWLASRVSSLGSLLQEGNISDFAKNQIQALPQTIANDGITSGIKHWLPEAQFRGGITLEDASKYRSAEADLLIPLYQSTSSILFGQLGLRDYDNNSFNGRFFVNTGIGWRQDVGDWLLGINSFLDADVRYDHLRGSLGVELFRDSMSLAGNWYFPLSDWKASKVQPLHDERPATGIDVRLKGALPSLPWFGAELAFEQYFGDKVDILGNDSLTRDPAAFTGAITWKPVPLVEIKAGYKDAGSSGSQTEAGLNLNYTFGVPLRAQLDPSQVRTASNTTNRTVFVDRNYNIVMDYREQASRIRVYASPVNGQSGDTVTLSATINSRYPVERIEWTGDAELIGGLQQQGNVNSGLRLPDLSLDVTENKEYSLYLKVTDSRGNSVTSERIPVTVSINPESFTPYLNVLHDEVRREEGKFVIPSPTVNDDNGSIIEWHYVRVRSKDEWKSLKPENVEYSTHSPGLSFKSLGGEERDGQWIEKVQLVVKDPTARMTLAAMELNISATGPGGTHPVNGTIRMTPVMNLTDKVSSVQILFTAGTEELNGSTNAPVVGSTLQAKTTCDTDKDCSSLFRYQWEISPDGNRWYDVPGATGQSWLMPAVMDGHSLQNKQVRVRVVSENVPTH
ncbi:inverse autotransporter beta domain-containing protein [Escherichia fergusonii]|uniref:inverse autotransporter beta domain-containing protein n=1 Tax=Escherichia fergusonii TaxID=564 RepID=UPI002FD50A5D